MLRDPTTITGKPSLRVSCTRVLANVWPIVNYYNFELIEKERKKNGIAGGGGRRLLVHSLTQSLFSCMIKLNIFKL